MIHVIVILINQVRQLHEEIPLLLKPVNDGLQALGRILRVVVEEDDGSVFQVLMVYHMVYLELYAFVHPIPAINIRYKNRSVENTAESVFPNDFYLVIIDEYF